MSRGCRKKYKVFSSLKSSTITRTYVNVLVYVDLIVIDEQKGLNESVAEWIAPAKNAAW